MTTDQMIDALRKSDRTKGADVEVILKGCGTIEVNDCVSLRSDNAMEITTMDKSVKYFIPIDSIVYMRVESHDA